MFCALLAAQRTIFLEKDAAAYSKIFLPSKTHSQLCAKVFVECQDREEV